MSLYPELEAALVDAARRRHSPRRRVLRLGRLAAPAGAVAAAAAVVWVLASGPPDSEQAVPPVATLAPTDQLSRTYEPFRMPATGSDRLPVSDAEIERLALVGGAKLDPERVRLLASNGDRRVYAVAASRPEPGVCLLSFSDTFQEAAACTDIDEPSGRSSMLFLPIGDAYGPAGAIAAIAADGVDQLELRFRDGSSERRAFVDNALYVLLDRPPERLSWVDPNGRSHSFRTSEDGRPVP
jgi:hypothetical protein